MKSLSPGLFNCLRTSRVAWKSKNKVKKKKNQPAVLIWKNQRLQKEEKVIWRNQKSRIPRRRRKRMPMLRLQINKCLGKLLQKNTQQKKLKKKRINLEKNFSRQKTSAWHKSGCSNYLQFFAYLLRSSFLKKRTAMYGV